MIRPHPDGCTLAVRAQPGAKKSAIVGIYGSGDDAALKIAIQSPPIDGRANDALIAFLAATLSIAKSSVELLSGSSSRSKVYLLRGLAAANAASALRKASPAEVHFPGTE